MKKIILLSFLLPLLLLAGCSKDEETDPTSSPNSITSQETIVANGIKFTLNGVSFTMIDVQGGTFRMGAQRINPDEQNYDSNAQSDESPVHQVTLSDYYIGETEVTQELWKAVTGSNPSHFTGDLQRPVEQVSWDDIVNNFLPALNAATGRTFALPTEAQWEFAARGGNNSHGYLYAGGNTATDIAWVRGHSNGQTHPVGQKWPNELGLYDISGNVSEWCNDWYGDYSSGSQTDPTGLSSGSRRVRRGGSWNDEVYNCRVSSRSSAGPINRYDNYGFRLVLVP